MFATPVSSVLMPEEYKTCSDVGDGFASILIDQSHEKCSHLVQNDIDGVGDSFENETKISNRSNSDISLRGNASALLDRYNRECSSTSVCTSCNTTITKDQTASSSNQTSPVAGTMSSIGVNLRVTGQCSQGGRKYMEDYFSVAYQEAKDVASVNCDGPNDGRKELEYAFFGIYDGHGGAEAALFAKENLMIEIVSQQLFWSDSDEDVLRAIREGYIATHFAMWREHERWPRTANGHLSTAGTTATIAFLRREKIYIGHVGDSGVVLGYQNGHENFWRAKPLTTDHKPESAAERQRIQRAGGSVTVKSGVPRVVWNRPRDPNHRGPIKHNTPVDDIPFLAVARSLGDLWSYNSEHNEFVVSPDPDVQVVKIDPKTFRCLIFGTDGLWNVINAQEAVDSVFEKERFNIAMRKCCSRAAATFSPGGGSKTTCMKSSNPSKGLVEKALKTWSSKKMRADNTSVVTVILYPNISAEYCSHDEMNGVDSANAKPLSLFNSINNKKESSHPITFDNDIVIEQYEPKVPYSVVARKYLPPLEYRDFNFYEGEDEEESVIEEMDRMDYDEEDDEAKADNFVIKKVEPMTYDLQLPRRCEWNSTSYIHQHHHVMAWRKPFEKPNEWVELEIDRVGNCDTISAEISTSTPLVSRPTSLLMENVHYLNASPEEVYSGEIYDESMDDCDVGLDMSDHSYGQYVNQNENLDSDTMTDCSFAESYNTLLNEQEARNHTNACTTTPISTNTDTSSSNVGVNMPCVSTYQSIDSTCLQEILQEQQRYQEQEGYSLTKLETRREQQRRVGTTPFEHQDSTEEVRTGADWSQYYVTTTMTSTPKNRYQHRQEQILEIETLLPHVCSEKKIEMGRLQQHTLQHNVDNSSNSQVNADNSSNFSILTSILTPEQACKTNNDRFEETSQPLLTSTSFTNNKKSLKIIEVNSSDVIEKAPRSTVEYIKKTVEEIRLEDSSAVNFIFEQIKKLKDIDYKPVSSSMKSAVGRAVAIATCCTDQAPDDKPPLSTRTMSAMKTRRMRYRNVPNENAVMQTRHKSIKFKRKQPHSYIKRSAATIIAYNTTTTSGRNTKPATTNNTNSCSITCSSANNVTSAVSQTKSNVQSTGPNNSVVRSPYATRYEARTNKRQLRSGVCSIDKNQHTLRTRNSLPKSLKANVTSRNQSLQISSGHQKRTTTLDPETLSKKRRSVGANSGSSPNLKHSKNERKHHQNLRESLMGEHTDQMRTNVSSSTPGSKRSVTSQPLTYINLRSRRIFDQGSLDSSATVTTIISPPLIVTSSKRLEYNRSIRRTNASGESVSSSVGALNGGNFSKSTRLQSTMNSIAARPPPSPKKLTLGSIGSGCSSSTNSSISARQTFLAAAAAAVAASSCVKTTEVLADFSKRWSLRSKRSSEVSVATTSIERTSTALTTLPTTAVESMGLCNITSPSSLNNAITCYNNTKKNVAIASRTRMNRKR